MPAGSLEKHLGFQQARAQPHAQVLRACMPGGGNLGLCRNISHKSRVQEVLAIGTRCHERIPVAECMVGRLWKEFLPHSHQAPYIPTSCKRCLVFKSQSLLVLQGRRLCGSHKYCDPQCVHGCESNQDQPKTGHQVQNFITSSVHKARVSSANLRWIAWLCYPLRKGHPGKRIALAKGQLPRLALEKGCPLKKGVCHKQSLRKDVPCKREIAKINPWERMLLNAKGNPLQKGTATLALELFGHPLGKGKIPALILAKG